MVRRTGIVMFIYAGSFLVGCETYFIAPTAWFYVKSLGQDEVLMEGFFRKYHDLFVLRRLPMAIEFSGM